MRVWTEVCQQIFSQPINIWLDELSPLFANRVKVSPLYPRGTTPVFDAQ